MAIDGHTNKIDSMYTVLTNIKKERKKNPNRNENVIELGVVRGSSIKRQRRHCRSMCLPYEGRSQRRTHALFVRLDAVVDVVFYVLDENVTAH